MSRADDNTLVFLIHGTFAKNASWTRDGSPFRRQLVAESNADMAFEAPKWSGRNSGTARERAARGLARKLDELTPSSNRSVFVVGHSHGGNIALRALELANNPENVDGLICLNTPFLSIEKSNPTKAPAIYRHVAIIPASIFLMFAILAPALLLGIAISTLLFGELSFLILLVSLLVGVTAWGQSLEWLYRSWKGNDQGLHDKGPSFPQGYGSLVDQDLPVLVIRAEGDEAYNWLRPFDMLTRAIAGTPMVAVNICGLFCMAIPLLLLTMPIWIDEWDWLDPELLLNSWPIGLAGITFVVVLDAFALLLRRGVRGMPFTFGESLFGDGFNSTSTSGLPGRVRNFDELIIASQECTALAHSSGYAATSAISCIAKWIRKHALNKYPRRKRSLIEVCSWSI